MLDRLFAGILGLTIIDFIAVFDIGFLSDIDSTIKTIFIVLGLVFYILAIPHKLKMQKYKQREKQLEIQTKELELKEKYNKFDLDLHKREIGHED
jgi:membrane protein YdbS with pleckstrin-like domain